MTDQYNTLKLVMFFVKKQDTAQNSTLSLFMHHSNIVERYGDTVCGKDVKFRRQKSAFYVHHFKALAVYKKPSVIILQHKNHSGI